jgi:hypothetical protein
MNRNMNRVNYVEQQVCVERTVSRLSRVQLWRTSTAVKLLTAVLDIWFILSGNNGNEADLLTTYTVDTGCLSTDCGCSVGDIKAALQATGSTNLNNMPLETLPDPLDDATHDGLDKAVNETVEDDITDAEDLSARDHAQLLSAIIENCDDLDNKYVGLGQAKRMIKTHGELRVMLTSAWRRKSYREIRNLGACLRSAPIIYLLTSF